MSETRGSTPTPQDDVSTTIAKYYGAENVPDLYGLDTLRAKAANRSDDLLDKAKIGTQYEMSEQRQQEAIEGAKSLMNNVYHILHRTGRGDRAETAEANTSYGYNPQTNQVEILVNSDLHLDSLDLTYAPLPDNLHVAGSLSLNRSTLDTLPNGLHVEHTLRMPISTELPDDAVVQGEIIEPGPWDEYYAKLGGEPEEWEEAEKVEELLSSKSHHKNRK